MNFLSRFLLLAGCMALDAGAAIAQEAPRTGPETEKRFPPLKVPPGFKATLFACDPLVAYPSAIALGPREGTVFMAADYMTGLGTEIVRRDEVQLVEDSDGDGYADKSTLVAAGFNSIQGMTYHDGTVFVMHAPFLTALRDTDGDGKADERRDLLKGLGLTPEENPVRLHCANGLVAGHDGWLYLAIGDHGCDVKRPEGDRLALKGGGILRCRTDGGDLHVFAYGLRNIYDVALDAELNVFVRDNENDGGDYKVRVCHSFHGADHGYPYLYHERPDEALAPLADLGLGSSAGGLAYLETAFPPEYRGNLFFCEWGRSVVRYQPTRSGGGFGPVKEIEFAAGAANDPYGFKPTDLVVDRDGSLLVADWADGQRPKRGRARIYRISFTEKTRAFPKKGDTADWLPLLDAEGYYQRLDAHLALERQGEKSLTTLRAALEKKRLGVRARLHAVWILARVEGAASLPELLALVSGDPDPRVRAQAVRAIADLSDPVLVQHRLDAKPAEDGRDGKLHSSQVAKNLAAFAIGQDASVVLEIVIALGRLRWPGTPEWLNGTLRESEGPVAHAAMQALRRSDNWPEVLKLLDEPSAGPVRRVALRACAEQFDTTVVDGLIARLKREKLSDRRHEYADALTRVHRKAGPGKYWGYRPGPRPANSEGWDRTAAIAAALQGTFHDPDRSLRLSVLQRMQREKIPVEPGVLRSWLNEERGEKAVAAILVSLRGLPAADVRDLLAHIAADKKQAAANRLVALTLFAEGLDGASEFKLLEHARVLEDGPLLVAALRHLGKRRVPGANVLLLAKVDSPESLVRAAALESLAEAGEPKAASAVAKCLSDRDPGVRAAAAAAAGKLGFRPAAATLLNLVGDGDPGVRRASLHALRLLREPGALKLAVRLLHDREVQDASLKYLDELGGPDQSGAVVEAALKDPTHEILASVVSMLVKWGKAKGLPAEEARALKHAVARLQGGSGMLLSWSATEAATAEATEGLIEKLALPSTELDAGLRTLLAAGLDSRVALGPGKGEGSMWLAVTDVHLDEPASVQFLASSGGSLRVWLNGTVAYRRDEARPFQADSDRFDVSLKKGVNRLLVLVATAKVGEFHLRFRRKSATAENENLTLAALTRTGSAARGRAVFLNVEKSLCLKCHRLGDQGEAIGPELTGIGTRFPRIHLIESILEPSRTVGPAFQTLVVEMNNGQLHSGLKVAESETTLTLADQKGKKQVLARADIQEQKASAVSVMPEGIARQLTLEEFVDLIAFLTSQKELRAPK